MATARWETMFDLIGLTAYLTLMTGQLPDSEFLRKARRGTSPQLLELPANAERPVAAKQPVKTAEAA